MNIESMRAFLEISSAGSFQLAAERLHITQSAISARIQRLEERLNCRLFIRKRSGVELTDAGKRLTRHAQNCVQSWERAQQEIALPAEIDNQFSLGIQINLWNRLALTWCDWMAHEAPQIATRIVADYSDTLVSQVRDGMLDLALVFAARPTSRIVIEDFDEAELILVSTEPRSLNIGRTPGYIFVDWAEDFLSQHSMAFPDSPPPRMSIGSSSIALDHILTHGGSAYLARDDVNSLIDSGRLSQVNDSPVFKRKSYLVYSSDSLISEPTDIAVAGLKAISHSGGGA